MPTSKPSEPSLRRGSQPGESKKVKLAAGQQQRVDQLFSKLTATSRKPGAWKPYSKG